MKKRHVFRPDALDGLEVRLAPSTVNPGAWLTAQVASIEAKVHHGDHHHHHGGHHGGSHHRDHHQ